MPQLQSAEQLEEFNLEKSSAQPYGAAGSANNTLTLQERMMKRFAPHQFVRVKNIDSETVVWQYLPTDKEEFEYTPDPMKITHRDRPEMWAIHPGESEVIVGANAYLMINTLYKNLVAKKVVAGSPDVPGRARNFNYADGQQMEDYLDQIFMGVETPTFGQPEPVAATTDRDETYEAKAIEAEKSKKTGVAGGRAA